MRSKLLTTSLVLGLLLIPIDQMEPQQGPEKKSVTVNGRRVEGILVGGRLYVSVDHLARQLNGSITYRGEETVVQVPSGVQSSAEFGRIRGTITYHSRAGNSPDSGAKVWLLQEPVETPCGGMFFGDASQTKVGGREDEIVVFDYSSAAPRKYTSVRRTITDGNGNFELGELPPGEYTLILESGHVNGPCQRDVLRKKAFFRVVVRPGETADKSYDFGMGYL